MNTYLRIGFGAPAVLLVALVACQMATRDVALTSGPSPTHRAATTPAPSSLGLYSPEDLRRAILIEIGAPEGLTVDDTKAGVAAIAFSPVGTGFDVIPKGFVDALTTSLNSTEAGGYISWGALFETSTPSTRSTSWSPNTNRKTDGGSSLRPTQTSVVRACCTSGLRTAGTPRRSTCGEAKTSCLPPWAWANTTRPGSATSPPQCSFVR